MYPPISSALRVTLTNPAIVAQASVQRLPRRALLGLCLVYLLAGFVGRDAWRHADLHAFGFMTALYQGEALWLDPTLLGKHPEFPALLPYWLGAWAMQLTPTAWAQDAAVRIPFAVLLALTFAGTWYGCYYLARTPAAQPVAFAFGGEAKPTDYARALADGGLLALLASLGLGQLGHETTPAAAQLGFATLLFFSFAALPYHRTIPILCAGVASIGLSLSGAPFVSLLLGLGGAYMHAKDTSGEHADSPVRRYSLEAIFLLAITLLSAFTAYVLGLWAWKVEWPAATLAYWDGHAQLLLWFSWPAWPLAIYSVWRWRQQVFRRSISRHLALPMWFISCCVGCMVFSDSPDRTLLLALPAFATLAAFALPTLQRQFAALVDWFTLLFFTGCGIVIWVVWIAMQTGFPPQPAANVERLAPGFVSSFSTFAFGLAIVATVAWGMLVRWRAGRHRSVLWKSLVLPASGATLCWLLLMTLWMPLLDYAQSARAVVEQTTRVIPRGDCATVLNMDGSYVAALQWYGHMDLNADLHTSQCRWLLTEPPASADLAARVDMRVWQQHTLVAHPVASSETFWILQRR